MTNSEETSVESFESALEELNKIVKRMEAGEQSLEQSLQDFERGIKLAKQCQQQLEHAEQRVKMLMEQNDGSEVLQDVNEDLNEDDVPW